MSEEAERQFQQSKMQADSIVQTDQPETVVSSSFVNVNFEMEEDCEVVTEQKQQPTSVPPQDEMTYIKCYTLNVNQELFTFCLVGLKTTIYILNY